MGSTKRLCIDSFFWQFCFNFDNFDNDKVFLILNYKDSDHLKMNYIRDSLYHQVENFSGMTDYGYYDDH